MGLNPPREGRIKTFGIEDTRWSTFRIARWASAMCRRDAGIRQLDGRGELKVPLERSGP